MRVEGSFVLDILRLVRPYRNLNLRQLPLLHDLQPVSQSSDQTCLVTSRSVMIIERDPRHWWCWRGSECEHNKCQQTTGAGANTGVSAGMWSVVAQQRGTQTERHHGVINAFLGSKGFYIRTETQSPVFVNHHNHFMGTYKDGFLSCKCINIITKLR